ncbi:hypothetical protein WJX77_010483 [Trebouxia sp. C0004]
MPLVVLCGQPSSAKSSVASAIAQHLHSQGHEFVLISEDTLHQERNVAYRDSTSEKRLRGGLKATADRSLSKHTTVILDSINAIKGYRYELWCLARAAGTRYCVVHCDVPIETAQEWNLARNPAQAYSQAVFDDLTSRFERPDARNRWDKPLYTIHPASEDFSTQLQETVLAVTGTSGKKGDVHAASVSSELVPTSATSNPFLSATNLLHDVDKAAQEVISAVNDAQTAAAGGPAGHVSLGPSIDSLVLQEQVTMPELRRHKRAFLKLVTQIHNNRVQSPHDAKRMFADYLQTKLN